MAALADHLWQSCLCLVAIALLTLTLRQQSAALRLWLWRIAALKFLAPFAVLYIAGKWLGFPVPYAADPAPAFLVRLFGGLEPLLAPAQTASLGAGASMGVALLLVALTAAWSFAIAKQMRIEATRAHWERIDVEFGAAEPPGMGFIKAASVTAVALCVAVGAVAAGGVEDRQQRHALLIVNALSLRQAKVEVTLALPGMGERSRVFADANGVTIRNANVRELLAIAYGVGRAAVFGNQMVSSRDADPSDYWLIWPRYDVRVTAPVREPERFEPYALHQAITRMLSERFGIGVMVNGKCAPPCGRYGIPMSESPL